MSLPVITGYFLCCLDKCTGHVVIERNGSTEHGECGCGGNRRPPSLVDCSHTTISGFDYCELIKTRGSKIFEIGTCEGLAGQEFVLSAREKFALMINRFDILRRAISPRRAKIYMDDLYLMFKSETDWLDSHITHYAPERWAVRLEALAWMAATETTEEEDDSSSETAEEEDDDSSSDEIIYVPRLEVFRAKLKPLDIPRRVNSKLPMMPASPEYNMTSPKYLPTEKMLELYATMPWCKCVPHCAHQSSPKCSPTSPPPYTPKRSTPDEDVVYIPMAPRAIRKAKLGRRIVFDSDDEEEKKPAEKRKPNTPEVGLIQFERRGKKMRSLCESRTGSRSIPIKVYESETDNSDDTETADWADDELECEEAMPEDPLGEGDWTIEMPELLERLKSLEMEMRNSPETKRMMELADEKLSLEIHKMKLWKEMEETSKQVFNFCAADEEDRLV